MSLVVPATTIQELTRDAERSFERGEYPASVHDVYVRAYIEAIVEERQKHEQEAA